MTKQILTAEGRDKVIEELELIVSTLLPQVEEKIEYGEDKGHDLTELIGQRDFYKNRITYLENMVATAKVVGPMKYFEVVDPYYAIIKARTKKEAMQQYTDVIADDDGSLSEEMKEVSRDYALVKFARSTGADIKTLNTKELLEEFDDVVPCALIISGDLL